MLQRLARVIYWGSGVEGSCDKSEGRSEEINLLAFWHGGTLPPGAEVIKMQGQLLAKFKDQSDYGFVFTVSQR